MQPNSLSLITNYLAISDRVATGGQPAWEQFAAIHEAGYQVVINLALSTSSKALPNEGELVTRLGMTYIHIPVQWEQPTVEDFIRFRRVMNAFEDKRVLVHCALNMRVSCFVFLLRVLYQEVAVQDARNDLEKIWLPNEVWQKFMGEVLKNSNPKIGAEK